MMRVVGGTVGGRRLAVPSRPMAIVRPTSDLIRGAIFNSLHSLGVVQGARVWDLFAGSGALGIEALSRGAATALFVERDGRAVQTIVANVADLGLGERATVVRAEAMAWLQRQVSSRSDDRADLVLLDPPYAFSAWDQALGTVRAGMVVAESDRALDPPAGWRILKVLRHGGTVVSLLVPRGAPNP